MENLKIGNRVYIPTPSHGFVEAKIVNIKNEDNKIKSISLKYIDDFIKETYGNDEVVYMNSNLQKIKTKLENEDRPFYWKFQNKKEFPEWVTKTFMKYNTCDTVKNNSKFDFLPQQKFIRDYLQNNSPYRGLLLYHGLGTGKTCAAVAVSENLKDTRNIIIFLPASIKNNFITGIKDCGSPDYKSVDGNKLIESKYSFVSYNASNVVKQIEALGSLDNKVIIVDEAHRLATIMVNGLSGMGKQGYDIYKYLLEAKNSKILFLTGTPLVNTPFEITILFNILRGPIELIIFKINNYNENTIDDYMSNITQDERIGWIELNRKNQSLQVILKLNSWDMEFEQTVRYIETKAKLYNFYVNFERTDSIRLFPENEDEFNSFFVKDDIFINKDMFQRRIIGLTSFYQTDVEYKSDFPEQFATKIMKVEMSSHQFELYQKARDHEKKKERMAARNMKKKEKGKVSTLARVFSREFSNFVFPDEIIRPFQRIQFISDKLEEKIHNEKQDNNTSNTSNKEIKYNKETIDTMIMEALEKLSDPTKEYLKSDLSKYSPKMKAMLDEINKSEKELILIYSAYRNVEGSEIFSRILNANGYERYNQSNKSNDYKRYSFFSGNEDEKERKKIIETYTHPDNKNGKYIRILLISSSGAEGLDLKNIRKVLITEPYWHDVRLQQIIGRAVRKKSHYDLPENERNVQPIIYLSVMSPEQLNNSKEKMSTDEYIYEVSQKKLKLNNNVLKAVQEASIDCELHNCKKTVNCYKFKGKDDDLAYMPRLTDDIIYGYQNKKSKKNSVKQIVVSGITEKNEIVYLKENKWFYGNGKPFDGKPDIVKGKKYAVDLGTLEVFDYKTIQTTPKIIGTVNPLDSTLVKS